jgi:hypothetical protein
MESALGTGARHRDEAQRRLCCASGPNLNSGQGRLARAFKLPWGSGTRVPQVGSTSTGWGLLVNFRVKSQSPMVRRPGRAERRAHGRSGPGVAFEVASFGTFRLPTCKGRDADFAFA